jgi:hypothetical protein
MLKCTTEAGCHSPGPNSGGSFRTTSRKLTNRPALGAFSVRRRMRDSCSCLSPPHAKIPPMSDHRRIPHNQTYSLHPWRSWTARLPRSLPLVSPMRAAPRAGCPEPPQVLPRSHYRTCSLDNIAQKTAMYRAKDLSSQPFAGSLRLILG